MNNNKISWTIEDSNGIFSNLVNLQDLFLISNNIKSVNTRAFSGLDNIQRLDISNNNITSVQKDAFSHMLKLKVGILKFIFT